MNVFMVWLQFLISAALVIVGGFYLARNGKELGERHGLSDLWVGFIFLAAVTSIPELATALGAVLIAHSPSLALSDILGSNAFNLFIIFVISVCLARRPITADLSLAPFRLLLLMIILMTGLLMVFAALNRNRQLLSPGGISLASWAVAILYLAGSWKLFRDELPPGAIRKKKEKGRCETGSPGCSLLPASGLSRPGGGRWILAGPDRSADRRAYSLGGELCGGPLPGSGHLTPGGGGLPGGGQDGRE